MAASPEIREYAVHRAGRIFAILKQYAELGKTCPSNKLLAERVGCESTSTIAEAISFLAVNGMITVERANNSRVVTITATGKKTAGQVRKPHHSAKVNASQVAA